MFDNLLLKKMMMMMRYTIRQLCNMGMGILQLLQLNYNNDGKCCGNTALSVEKLCRNKQHGYENNKN